MAVSIELVVSFYMMSIVIFANLLKRQYQCGSQVMPGHEPVSMNLLA